MSAPFFRSTAPTRSTATIAVRGHDSLAREFGLPSAAERDTDWDFLLVWTGTQLELHDRRDPKLKALRVDFPDLDLRAHAAGLSRRQPLARAVGKAQLVADATAGLAQDALRLALMGYRVIAMERSRAIGALVADALRRIGAHPLQERLQLLNGDARELLPTLKPRPEVVYLDPMFPAKRRGSAAVRKELRWLRDLVGDDTDALELFEVACQTATHRVVVKRPDHAAPLAPTPVAAIAGKLVRYDIYSTRLGS